MGGRGNCRQIYKWDGGNQGPTRGWKRVVRKVVALSLMVGCAGS